MSISFLYSFRQPADPTKLHIIALPEWAQVSFKSSGRSLESVWDSNNHEMFASIFSDMDLNFHGEVTYHLNELLFGDSAYSLGSHQYLDALEKVRDAWHNGPFTRTKELNLHPVIVGSNAIAIINYKGDDVAEVCATDIYERLLRCVHTLVSRHVGLNVYNSDVVRNIIERIRVGRKTA